MTEAFENLSVRPQSDMWMGDFSFEERQRVRRIQVSGRRGNAATNSSGERFSTIYYVDRDEKRAAEEFVAENRSQLEDIDFEKSNVLQSSVDRQIYDKIMVELGERSIKKYRSVVVEERSEGVTWVFDRDSFEEPNRRYSAKGYKVAKVPEGCSLEDLFEACEGEISPAELREHGVEGTVSVVTQFFKDCGLFEYD